LVSKIEQLKKTNDALEKEPGRSESQQPKSSTGGR
jgi:hypothetical protein